MPAMVPLGLPWPGRTSLDPPPLTRRDRGPGERGRTGTNSTRLHTGTRHYPARIEAAIADEADHELDRTTRRMIRRSIARIIGDRHAELGPPACTCDPRSCRHLPALWAGYARRFGSCDAAKVFRNPLTGTDLALPLSCRVPGCPHCESERVDELRRRFLPLVEAADRLRAVFLTVPNVPAGELAAGWSRVSDGFARLMRSPLFRGVETCRTDRQRKARGHAPGETCAGHVRRCRAGKVGCLASIDGDELAARRECAGRCRRAKWTDAGSPIVGASMHRYCRPCPGHGSIKAALLAFETTVNRREATWHPHANLLYDGAFIHQARELKHAWARAVGLPVAHVWIRDAERPPAGHHGAWSRKHALFEAVKYAIKPDAKILDSSAPSWFVEWVEARRGRRLVRSYGAWHGIAELDDDDDAGEYTVPVIDQDTGRTYRLPLLDPITDDEADWHLLPGDAPRRAFLRVQPPSSDETPRRAWLVRHPIYKPPGADDGT